MVLDGEQPPLGLLVDEVLATEAVTEGRLRVMNGLSADGTAAERGITADGVVLLDGHRLLTDDRVTLSGHEHPRSAGRPITTSMPGEACAT